jgi:hypothetical protein
MRGVQRDGAQDLPGPPVRAANSLAFGDQLFPSSQTAGQLGGWCLCEVTRAYA